MATDLEDTFRRISELVSFPCDFPVKVLGARVDGFADTITAVAIQHVPDLVLADITMAISSKGGYISITLPVQAQSREQLQALYQAMAEHDLVRIVI